MAGTGTATKKEKIPEIIVDKDFSGSNTPCTKQKRKQNEKQK